MKILLICDELPFPPRNGVTIPTSSYICMLRQSGHEVDCLALLEREAEDEFLRITVGEVDRLFVAGRKKQGAFSRLVREMIMGIPSFHSWEYETDISELGLGKGYDVIIASPISVLDVALKAGQSGGRVVAGISDCYASVLSAAKDAARGHPLRWLVGAIRGKRMAGIEAALLRKCDAIIVQTERDVAWLRQIGGAELEARAFAISNGVSRELVDPKPEAGLPGPVLLFVANFTDVLYRRNLEWFYSSVWPLVRSGRRDARLRVVGKGVELSADLYRRLRDDPSVDLTGFVKSLCEVYSGGRVSVAPVFKSYGFINKVAEALMVGIPVVGDPSAFNGMKGALDVGGGLSAGSAQEFADACVRLLNDDNRWLASSRQARQFAVAELSWEAKREDFLRAVMGGLKSD